MGAWQPWRGPQGTIWTSSVIRCSMSAPHLDGLSRMDGVGMDGSVIDPVTPEMPTSGEIMRAVGRTEKAIDALSNKIDKLDDKLDGHAVQINSHELRITTLEKHDDARSKMSAQVKAALVAGALSIVATLIDTAITVSHH